MSTKQYRPSSRSWIKLWVNEWLTGTVRWQLTPQQRSIWADLLALAGRSRYPGIVCSGETNGVLDPFPFDYLCSVFRCSEADVRAAFDLFVAQSRMTINHVGVIHIVNWDKYQSEYQQKRQRTAYKKQNAAKSISNVHRKSSVEGEVEGEIEEEKKKKEPSPSSFEIFWEAYPKKLGRKEARRAWLKTWGDKYLGEILAGLASWKQAKQWQDAEFIPYPATFLNAERWKENPLAKSEKGPSLDEQRKELERRAGIV